MNKIRVIDLLNKIANGEEAPKTIKFENYIYKWRNMQKDYFCEKINHSLESIIGEYMFSNLNLEIEIIEEPKEIEKPKNYEDFESVDDYIEHLRDKIIELIDVVNELKKEEK